MIAEQKTSDEPAGGGDDTLRWYVLKVQSNREKSIRDNIVRRVKREGLEKFFGEIMIPTENVQSVGLRRIIGKDMVAKVYKILRDKKVEIDQQTWNRRYREYTE